MVIDAHLHLDTKNFPVFALALTELIQQMDKNGIDRAWLISNPFSNYDIFHLLDLSKGDKERFAIFSFLDVNNEHGLGKLTDKLVSLGLAGFKIHPRLQRLALDDKRLFKALDRIKSYSLPVIIDCFPSGACLSENSFGAVAFGKIAQRFSGINFVAAHAGGHRVLDFMLLAKEYKNVYLDISYSIMIYDHCSVQEDILYTVGRLKGKKILYGSDYPAFSLGESLTKTKLCFDEYGLNKTYFEGIFSANAEEVLGVQA